MAVLSEHYDETKGKITVSVMLHHADWVKHPPFTTWPWKRWQHAFQKCLQLTGQKTPCGLNFRQ